MSSKNKKHAGQKCVICGKVIGLYQKIIPYSDGRAAHKKCEFPKSKKKKNEDKSKT